MAVRDFSDIYTQSPRAAALRAESVHISKIPSMQLWYQLIYTTPTQRAFIYKAYFILIVVYYVRAMINECYNILS